jgi:hypothetical protein
VHNQTFLLMAILVWLQAAAAELEPSAQTGWRLVTILGLLLGVTAATVWCGATARRTPVAAGVLHAHQAGTLRYRTAAEDREEVLVQPVTGLRIPVAVPVETPQVVFQIEMAALEL